MSARMGHGGGGPVAETHGGRSHDHGGHDHEGAAHGTLRGYLTGFVLAVVLTAIPFWLVMAEPIADPRLTTVLVIGFAVAQIIVHMIYFLHMNTRSEGGWTMLALIFTVVLVVITLSGSLWIMYHLNANMMPVHAHDARTMP